MSLFHQNKIPPDMPSELLDFANALVDRLQRRKVAEIVLAEPGTGLRVPNLVRCYLQAHVRRCLTFIEAGVAELDANRSLAAELCTRAIYENAATICEFTDKLKALCEANDYNGVEALVSNAAFATRIPAILEQHGERVKAPQILKQIDKMKRRYPPFRNAYDHLSDIVHPNGLGAVLYFGNHEPGIMRFAEGGSTRSQERARLSLFLAVLVLLHVEVALVQSEEWLQKLSAVIGRGLKLTE
jgi:hypothetical protein